MDRIIQEADINRDGRIDFEEFIIAATGSYGSNHYKKREVEWKIREQFSGICKRKNVGGRMVQQEESGYDPDYIDGFENERPSGNYYMQQR